MKGKRWIKAALCLAALATAGSSAAKVTLPALLAENMVLQQRAKVLLWGHSTAKDRVTVRVSWDRKRYVAHCDGNGAWQVEVTTPSAGGPHTLTFDDGETLRIGNVYIGEVWLCSGQSNMEMPMRGYTGQPVRGSNEIIAEADPAVPIRMFTVRKNASKIPVDTVSGSWLQNSSDAVASFSATAYYFGLQLYRSLHVPVGLIHTSWGGSTIEAWMPADTLKRFSGIRLTHLQEGEKSKRPQYDASLLHNGMLYPLRNCTVKGVIWYQGESNAGRARQYVDLQQSFVKYLRALFRTPELPFYYTQIAPHRGSDSLSVALMREAQLECESLIPHSGMAVLTDCGEKMCIHPSRKELAGRRLAYLALRNDYGRSGVTAQPPVYRSKRIDGDRIILEFDRLGAGLTSFGKDPATFEIAGADRVFHPAHAEVQKTKVVVWSEQVRNPVAVRYAFRNFVVGDLFSVSGLPVSSFRTDF